MTMRLRKMIAWVYLVVKGKYTFVGRLNGQSHGELAYAFTKIALLKKFITYRRDGTNFGHHENLEGFQLICSMEELDENGQKKKRVSLPNKNKVQQFRGKR